ncbi:thermonuclease family protein [Pseudodesulfovibrio sp.]|nr:thermonuclease family protein [Pseudodesulfovibrio sp.]
MSHSSTFCILSLLLALLVFPTPSSAETGRFLTTIDGDSLLVEYKGRSREVRLIGIDAPEWGQEYGTQAKSHAMSFCYGHKLRLEFDKEKTDRYGRMLAYVYCGNQMLNEEMVRAGLAIVIKVKPNTKHHDRLKRAEKDAQSRRKGIWLHGGLKETPAQWRERHGKK